MSNFNKKGYTTILAKDARGQVQHFAVPKNSALANIAAHHHKKALKERQKHIRAYKAEMREKKKLVPLADRANIRWSA